MQTLSVADAKARLSALLTQVEAGEEVVITRRGVPIARIVAEPVAPNQPFDLAELFAFLGACRTFPVSGGGAVR